MTRDEAIQKAAKLLRLAQSDNPNEAGIAAAKVTIGGARAALGAEPRKLGGGS